MAGQNKVFLKRKSLFVRFFLLCTLCTRCWISSMALGSLARMTILYWWSDVCEFFGRTYGYRYQSKNIEQYVNIETIDNKLIRKTQCTKFKGCFCKRGKEKVDDILFYGHEQFWEKIQHITEDIRTSWQNKAKRLKISVRRSDNKRNLDIIWRKV